MPNYKVLGVRTLKLSQFSVDALKGLARQANEGIRKEHKETVKKVLKKVKEQEKVDIKTAKKKLADDLQKKLIRVAKRRKADLITDIKKNKKHIPAMQKASKPEAKEAKLPEKPKSPEPKPQPKPQYITRKIGGKIRRIPVSSLKKAEEKKAEKKPEKKVQKKVPKITVTEAEDDGPKEEPEIKAKLPPKSKQNLKLRIAPKKAKEKAKEKPVDKDKEELLQKEKEKFFKNYNFKVGDTIMVPRRHDKIKFNVIEIGPKYITLNAPESANPKFRAREFYTVNNKITNPKQKMYKVAKAAPVNQDELKAIKKQLKDKGVSKMVLKFIKTVEQAKEKLEELEEEAEEDDDEGKVIPQFLTMVASKDRAKLEKLVLLILPPKEFSKSDQRDYLRDLKEMGEEWNMNAFPRIRYEEMPEAEKELFRLMYPSIFAAKPKQPKEEKEKKERKKVTKKK